MILKPDYIDKSAYYTIYTDLVNETHLFESFDKTKVEVLKMLNSLTEEESKLKYAEGKWTIKQVLNHIVDSERILSYRALCIARNEPKEIPGYDEDIYASNDNSANLFLSDIEEEFNAVRDSTIQLFKNMGELGLHRQGLANGLQLTPCLLGWMISGHGIHHINILKERYLL